jgi:hypothetical protein
MNDKELSTNILGITAPWKIETVKLNAYSENVVHYALNQ